VFLIIIKLKNSSNKHVSKSEPNVTTETQNLVIPDFSMVDEKA